MAPNGDVFPEINQKTANFPKELLIQRTISEISYGNGDFTDFSPPISETESAKCECCGLTEEFTPNYVKKVREKHCGRMICGLCAAAVSIEKEKNGDKMEVALQAHVTTCARFNRIGIKFPVLEQAEAMREILRRSRAKSLSPREKSDIKWNKGSISRSSSCIPAITRDFQI